MEKYKKLIHSVCPLPEGGEHRARRATPTRLSPARPAPSVFHFRATARLCAAFSESDWLFRQPLTAAKFKQAPARVRVSCRAPQACGGPRSRRGGKSAPVRAAGPPCPRSPSPSRPVPSALQSSPPRCGSQGLESWRGIRAVTSGLPLSSQLGKGSSHQL